ncbi:hypothetical protein [Fodinibacter luteus]|uniref:hypothetical protein n=1 Tax=Fodinibacter luteus TaxID=552064 RepID=UPI0031E517F3
MTISGRPALGLVVVVVAAALSACSGDGGSGTASASGTGSSTATATATAGPTPVSTAPTVAEVYREARTAALSAASGHAVGTQTREGKTLRIDVEGNAAGSNQTVFITTPEGGTAEVRTVDGDYWLGGDEAFWVEQTGDEAAGRDMVGKYVQITESDATELGSFTLRSILSEKFALPEFAAFETDTGPVGEAEVEGRAAYVLGEEGGARLWVSADGSATLLRAVGPQSAPSDLEFSDWGRAQVFEAPESSQVVEG